ncbi:MAG: hypothetical protein II211_04585, partial [Peptococcaceae bacterium]|nr:hypothetical protein [Peptococcaceae bacterium]
MNYSCTSTASSTTTSSVASAMLSPCLASRTASEITDASNLTALIASSFNEITAPMVRIVGDNVEPNLVVPIKQAIAMADEMELDLIEI